VEVWRASLDPPASALARLRELLAPGERERAARFRQPEHGRRFAAGRGMLRTLLGRHLDAPPAQIAFETNPYGKPRLAGALQGAGLEFNLSHSRDVALFAFARGRAVGVDVEVLRPDFGGLAIARRFFAPGEVRRLEALPEAARVRAFFECWTRKEACVKARGDGLFHALESFEAGFGPGCPAAILHPPDEARRWRVFDLDAAPDCAAALVAEGRVESLSAWNWPPPGFAQ
jgi:4'-phosphopantetheinyl transferase